MGRNRSAPDLLSKLKKDAAEYMMSHFGTRQFFS